MKIENEMLTINFESKDGTYKKSLYVHYLLNNEEVKEFKDDLLRRNLIQQVDYNYIGCLDDILAKAGNIIIVSAFFNDEELKSNVNESLSDCILRLIETLDEIDESDFCDKDISTFLDIYNQIEGGFVYNFCHDCVDVKRFNDLFRGKFASEYDFVESQLTEAADWAINCPQEVLENINYQRIWDCDWCYYYSVAYINNQCYIFNN